MKKCGHCGVFVPVEKAFCPNCSEPMEPEEAPNRAPSVSSDMMSTLRDDPDQYREVMQIMKQKNAAAAATTEAPAPAIDSARAAPSVTAYDASYVAPDIAPPAKTNKRKLALALGAISILILLFALLLILKVF